jgi:2'-5' RNA ligase
VSAASERLRAKLAAPSDEFGYQGVMVAIWPPEYLADRVALPGAEPTSKLHITLCFIGKLDELEGPSIATGWPALESAVAKVAAEYGPFEIGLKGTGTFEPTEHSDGKRPMFAQVRSPIIRRLRSSLVASLKQAGVPYEQNHAGPWVPHMTLDYLADGEEPVPVDTNWGDFVAQDLVVSIGPRRIAVPLGEAA